MISFRRNMIITFAILLMVLMITSTSSVYSQQIPIVSADDNIPVYKPEILQNWTTSRIRDIFVDPAHNLYFIAASSDGIIVLNKTNQNTFEKIQDDNLFWSTFKINTVYSVAATANINPQGEIYGYMFVAAGSQGLVAFNYTISNRFGFTADMLWTYRQELSVTQQVLLGTGIMQNHLIVTEGPQGISVLDISDPTKLDVAYTIPITQFFGKITYQSYLSEDLLFVSNGEEGVVEFKLTPSSYLQYAIYQTTGIQGISISVNYLKDIDLLITSEGEFGALIYLEKGSEAVPSTKAIMGYSMDGYTTSISVLSSTSTKATVLFSKTYAGWEEIQISKKGDNYQIKPLKKVTGISTSIALKVTENPVTYLVGGWDGNITLVSLQKITLQTNTGMLNSPNILLIIGIFAIIPIIRKKT